MTKDERKVLRTLQALVAELGLQLSSSDQLVSDLRQELRERAEAHERDVATLRDGCEAMASEVADLTDDLSDAMDKLARVRAELDS